MAVAERTALSIPAAELRVGDEITREGFITLTAIAVRVHEAHSLVAVDYTCFGGSAADSRAYAITEILTIRRTAAEGSH